MSKSGKNFAVYTRNVDSKGTTSEENGELER